MRIITLCFSHVWVTFAPSSASLAIDYAFSALLFECVKYVLRRKCNCLFCLIFLNDLNKSVDSILKKSTLWPLNMIHCTHCISNGTIVDHRYHLVVVCCCFVSQTDILNFPWRICHYVISGTEKTGATLQYVLLLCRGALHASWLFCNNSGEEERWWGGTVLFLQSPFATGI